MNINQLNTEQLEELAQSYLTEHYHEYNPDAAELEGPSYGELAAALDIVGRDTLATEYADTVFSSDDFSCTAQQPEHRRHYYAIYSPQGIHNPSPYDTLYRYNTAQYRAERIDRVNLQTEQEGPLYGRGIVMQAVSRAWAEKRFPRAFARDVIVWRSWSDGDRHFTRPFWRDDECGEQEFTGHPRNVIRDTYEVREIDAWAEYDDPDDPEETPSWVWNTSYRLGEFTTAGDVPRAFRRALAKMGVQFYRGRTVTEYDGDVYEICDRATHEPLFAAIPQEA